MNAEETLVMQGIKLEIAYLSAEMAKISQRLPGEPGAEALPEWLCLEKAVALKVGVARKAAETQGGAEKLGALNTFRRQTVLQPCCGRRYEKIGGRRCWRKADVLEWLAVTDDGLEAYARKFGVNLAGCKGKK